MYINDISCSSDINMPLILFADDFILYRQIETQADVRILQNEWEELEEWEKIWKMKLNIDKCIVCYYHKETNNNPLHFTQLPTSFSTLSQIYLGVRINSKLSINEFHLQES